MADEDDGLRELMQTGLALHQQGRLPEAERCYRRALGRAPHHGAAYLLLGRLLGDGGQGREALPYLRQATALDPGNAGAWHALGEGLTRLGGDGEAALRQALRLRPHYPECLNNLARLLADRGELPEAETLLRQALALAPDHADLHHHLGLLLLLMGRWEEGGREFAWRALTAKGRSIRLDAPAWQGEAAPGATLLLHAEEGLGDTVQSLRYLPLVAARVGRVAVAVQEPVMALVAGLGEGACSWSPIGAPLPRHDLHARLMDLPWLLGLGPGEPGAPYLTPDPGLSAKWRAALNALPRPRVGLAWAGNPDHRRDGERSLQLADLAPLARVAGVCFVSLQKGVAAAQAAIPPPGMQLIDLSPHLTSLAETAAVMAQLDLVVSVDTLAAHLAGALGRPVWTLHRFVPDWRWGLAGEGTPWYPTMRLFRQPRPGAWPEAVAALARALDEAVTASRPTP